MKTILLKYGIPQEIVIGIMMLYEDTQSMVRPTDGDTQYFKSQPVLQGDTLAPFL